MSAVIFFSFLPSPSLLFYFREENVLTQPLYEDRAKVQDTDILISPEMLLAEACENMHRRIHKKEMIGKKLADTDTCPNDANYTLFIFYTGHGGKVKDNSGESKSGGWCPTSRSEEHIPLSVINQQLNSIRKCTNPESDPNILCQGKCL